MEQVIIERVPGILEKDRDIRGGPDPGAPRLPLPPRDRKPS